MAKEIVVNLKRQVLTAYENKTKVFEFDCITGAFGSETDLGTFKIFRKHQKYTSNKYKAPMDYAMFFTNDGKAIHQSYGVWLRSYLKSVGLDSIGSHGCVGLAGEDASKLFDWAPINTTVKVVQE